MGIWELVNSQLFLELCSVPVHFTAVSRQFRDCFYAVSPRQIKKKAFKEAFQRTSFAFLSGRSCNKSWISKKSEKKEIVSEFLIRVRFEEKESLLLTWELQCFLRSFKWHFVRFSPFVSSIWASLRNLLLSWDFTKKFGRSNSKFGQETRKSQEELATIGRTAWTQTRPSNRENRSSGRTTCKGHAKLLLAWAFVY